MYRQPEIEAAYAGWAERLVAEGYRPYLLSFMFQPLGGSVASMGTRMLNDIERVYRIHATHVVRKANSPSHFYKLPIWICSLDRPVFKHAKQSLSDVVINDGQHGHAITFYSPHANWQADPAKHFEEERWRYIGHEHPLMWIDVEPITHRVGYVLGYARKSITRGLISSDATRILPVDRRTARALHLSDRSDAA